MHKPIFAEGYLLSIYVQSREVVDCCRSVQATLGHVAVTRSPSTDTSPGCGLLYNTPASATLTARDFFADELDLDNVVDNRFNRTPERMDSYELSVVCVCVGAINSAV